MDDPQVDDDLVRDMTEVLTSFCARRKAFYWTLDQLKANLAHYRETGESTSAPSLYSLRRRWNVEKDTVCLNHETGET